MTGDVQAKPCPAPPSPGPWPVGMRFIDVSFAAPGENLAYDELLLDDAENGRGADTLRIWESPVPFVVLGVSQVLREHVREEACARDSIGIQRRGSAGGCVLQGPGCLNFALVLSHERFPEIATIRGSYCVILGRLAAALRDRGIEASLKGVSDLAADDRKISGNAQRRRKRYILHHGTLLYAMQPEWMERYLVEPADRPSYRGNRTHRGFVTCLPLDAGGLREIVRSAFGGATGAELPRDDEIAAVKRLAEEKYSDHAWVYRR